MIPITNPYSIGLFLARDAVNPLSRVVVINFVDSLDVDMSCFNLAVKTHDERETVDVELAACGFAYKVRLNMTAMAEVVMREQPDNLRDYFLECLKFYRKKSIVYLKVAILLT